MRIAVKNMVCDRCVRVVGDIMRRLGYDGCTVEMGGVEIPAEPDAGRLEELSAALSAEGFELIRSRDAELVERVRIALIKLARSLEGRSLKLSAYLADAVGVDYTTLSRVFSSVEGRTVERYYIIQKIEYVKELIEYGHMTLSEIADLTGYSSVGHLSRQFKEVAGMTVTQYKSRGGREPLDKI